MLSQHWLFTIPLRLRSLLLRRKVDQELDDTSACARRVSLPGSESCVV